MEEIKNEKSTITQKLVSESEMAISYGGISGIPQKINHWQRWIRDSEMDLYAICMTTKIEEVCLIHLFIPRLNSKTF